MEKIADLTHIATQHMRGIEAALPMKSSIVQLRIMIAGASQ